MAGMGLYFGIIFYSCFFICMCVHKKQKKPQVKTFRFKSQLYYSLPNNDWIEKIMIFFISLPVFLISFLLCVRAVIFIDVQFESIYTKIIENILEIEGIIITYIGMIISIFTFYSALSPDEYYFRISKRDIFKKYRLYKIYQVLGALLVFSIICTIALLDFNEEVMWNAWLSLFYEIAIAVILVLGLYVVSVIGMLSMSKRRAEQYSLKKLYRIFWTNEPEKDINRNDESIYANLGYLLKQYIQCRVVKRKIENIRDIEYIEKIESYEDYYLSPAIIIGVFYLAVGGYDIFCFFKAENWFLMVVELVLLLGEGVILCCPKIQGVNQEYIVNLFRGTSGYRIKTKKRIKFIGDVCLYRNLFFEAYIHTIKNLMAFFCILSVEVDEKKIENIEKLLVEMIDCLRESEKEKREGFYNAVYYLPIFTCEYYVYNSNERMIPTEILNLYKSFNLSVEEKKIYRKMINSFIYDASLYRPNKKDIENARRNRMVNEQEYYSNYIDREEYWTTLNSK